MKNSYYLIGGSILVLVIVLGTFYMYSNGGASSITNQVATSTTATTTPEKPVTITPTPTLPVVKPPVSTAPHISSMEPSAAAAGSTVTIIGTGFDTTTNYITFGTSGGRVHPDGTADNVVATVGSPTGRTLTFDIPTSGPSGILCDKSHTSCIAVSAIRILPGTYPVTVTNKNGVSAPATFTVTAQ